MLEARPWASGHRPLGGLPPRKANHPVHYGPLAQQAPLNKPPIRLSGPAAIPRGRSSREDLVKLIAVYVVMMGLGDIADYLIGRVVERFWPAASLTIFLLLYFFFLWLGWKFAVRLTAPKRAADNG